MLRGETWWVNFLPIAGGAASQHKDGKQRCWGWPCLTA